MPESMLGYAGHGGTSGSGFCFHELNCWVLKKLCGGGAEFFRCLSGMVSLPLCQSHHLNSGSLEAEPDIGMTVQVIPWRLALKRSEQTAGEAEGTGEGAQQESSPAHLVPLGAWEHE